MYVYILQSLNNPNRYYTGITDNINLRLKEHNSLKCIHTKKYSPWKVTTFFAFEDKEKAFKFEKYLKTGSGRAFAKKHF